MTREEAISLLKQYIDYNNPDIPDFYTMEEACKVVINALEQQPTDAVDRVTIKEYLESYEVAQPKMGKWIMSDDGLYRPICNNCGAHPWKGYIPTVEEATEVFKYCPNCGSYNWGIEKCQ